MVVSQRLFWMMLAIYGIPWVGRPLRDIDCVWGFSSIGVSVQKRHLIRMEFLLADDSKYCGRPHFCCFRSQDDCVVQGGLVVDGLFKTSWYHVPQDYRRTPHCDVSRFELMDGWFNGLNHFDWSMIGKFVSYPAATFQTLPYARL